VHRNENLYENLFDLAPPALAPVKPQVMPIVNYIQAVRPSRELENCLGLLAKSDPWRRPLKLVSSDTLVPGRCHSGDKSAEIEIAMDERHRLATDIAKHFLTSHHEPTREDSRLFEDLQQFALEALKTVRSGDPAPQAAGQKGAWLPGEVRGYWPTRRPVQ
jgi:hypothetical protein